MEQAQRNKFDHICRKLLLRDGETLIDVGCGWGGFLIHAAQTYGITGVGVTLSKSQIEYGNARIAQLGLQDRIQIQMRDYREADGVYDKVASIGMLEHVGKEFFRAYIQKIASLLKADGLALTHFAGKEFPHPDDPWISRLFPGTHIPVLADVIREIGQQQLSVLDVENLRQHYYPTMMGWLEGHERNFAKIEAKYGTGFARAWRLYLVVSATSFKYGGNRLFQIFYSKGLNNDLPWTRDHLYLYQ